MENGETKEGKRAWDKASWDELYMTDPCPAWRDVTISVSSCATGWNGNSNLPRCPSPSQARVLGIRWAFVVGAGWLAAPVIPSAWAHVEEGGAEEKKPSSPSDHLRTQQSFSPLITREPIFSSHLVPSRPARPLTDGGWRLGTALPPPAWPPRRSPVVSQRTGLPLIDPSRQSFPGPEGSPTSPAKARHVTETGLVGHTANKHQPRDGVIPLGKVLSRPSPSGFCCCMALQRVRIRGRSEGKADCLRRSGTHAVMAELAVGSGDRRGPTRTTSRRVGVSQRRKPLGIR